MYFTYNGEEFKFRFKHQPNPTVVGGPRFTSCNVTKGENDEFVAEGFAKAEDQAFFLVFAHFHRCTSFLVRSLVV
jgi:hypothetical protein